MKIFIIEDEKAALRNLKAILAEVCPEAEIAGEADSICESIEWLESNDMPELVFMDIHLADGSAFEIFDHIKITCPIIFTTAYDEYALKAFKVNSIDYLLKPINAEDLRKAFDKLDLLVSHKKENEKQSDIINEIVKKLNKEENYKSHFLIPVKGDKFVPLTVDSILFFYISDGTVKAVDEDGRQHPFTMSLDDLADMLNPKLFFRANRQFLISRKAIKDISLWFNGRLVINLNIPFELKDKIIISKAKASEFKEWF